MSKKESVEWEASVLSFSLEYTPSSFELSHGHFRRLLDGCDHFNHWFLVFHHLDSWDP